MADTATPGARLVSRVIPVPSGDSSPALDALGTHAELHMWEAMAHGGLLNDAPEDQEIDVEIRSLLTQRFAS